MMRLLMIILHKPVFIRKRPPWVQYAALGRLLSFLNRRTVLIKICCIGFIFFSLNAAAQLKKGNIYALVVGVSEYSSPFTENLTYPSKDASDVYKLLRERASSGNIWLLLNKSATYDNIVGAANRLFTNAGSNDIVIFYFSGHGYHGGFVAYDKYLEYEELRAVFKKTKAKRKIIFADACFSGDIRTNNTGRSGNHFDVSGQKVCLFLSSRSNQTSIEDTRLKNGYFSYFLIAGLKGGADTNKDKIITARELFNFVNPKVRQYSRGEQAPVMWGKFDDTMEIVNWNK
ncbi:MAG: caspase family protein [Prevotellaceae bacterium]|jgi:hypothetical protein|nr:caspase family protein [Prevotellaceae bacterium]